MALDPAPLTWLESLSSNSIDSWERLKRVFIDNTDTVLRVPTVGSRSDGPDPIQPESNRSDTGQPMAFLRFSP
jgi:hypothetical protein